MSANPFTDSVVHLDAAELDVILDALDDATEYRHDCGGQPCGECEAAPDGLCWDHGADLDRAQPVRGGGAAAADGGGTVSAWALPGLVLGAAGLAIVAALALSTWLARVICARKARR